MAEAPKGNKKTPSKAPTVKADSDESKVSNQNPGNSRETQTPVLNGVTSQNGLPTLLDPWQVRDILSQSLSTLDELLLKVEGSLRQHYNVESISRHLVGARKAIAKELNLDVDDNGNVARSDGGTQLSQPSDNAGATGDESAEGKRQLKEAAANRKKVEKARADKAAEALA